MTALRPFDYELEWKSTPPPGVHQATHCFSFAGTVEEASTLLRTDYSAQTECLVIGMQLRTIISCLPHFIEEKRVGEDGLLPRDGRFIKIGMMTHRRVLLDQRRSFDKLGYLSNGTQRVGIKIVQ